jgi:hypothetical protein
VYRFDAGHGSLVIEETIRQVEVALDFALRHCPPTASGRHRGQEPFPAWAEPLRRGCADPPGPLGPTCSGPLL